LVRDCHATLDRGIATPIVHILLVEDNLAEARLLQEMLKGSVLRRYQLVHAKRLGEAIAQLSGTAFDVILLDLSLPDSQGLVSLDELIQRAPHLPIVVLTNTNDEELALEAVRRGAQDYLVKRQIDQNILFRALRYAIERKQAAEALREANEILEQRVQDRTADLAAANEQLRLEIDQRQRIQERLELALQASKMGTFEWHIQSNQVIWGAELEALYGVARGDFDGRYDDWIQTLHPEDCDRTEQALQQTVNNGQGLDTEFRILRPDGETRWIAAKSSIFYDAAGQPLRMIGVHMDITEKKQLEAQFLRAQRLESLGTLAGGIAHDLNNILTPILAAAKLLPHQVSQLDQQAQHLLTIVEESAQRGSELVNQILSFTRGVEGKRAVLQIPELIQEVERIIRQTLPKSITVHLDLAPDLWPVSGDATQLHQVLMNLCVNARDAMAEQGTLTITAANTWLDEQTARTYLDAQVGAYVAVTVADTGSGIPPEVLPRIFDPFFTTKAIGKGTGLGLSAVLGIVKSHGGFIDVQSMPHQGSQFKVFLPASQLAVASVLDTPTSLNGQQELILIVDDEAAICEILKTTLEAYNYRVLTASNGLEALALVADQAQNISCVLMDMMMPTMDGATTLPLLQRLNPDLHILAMSGLNTLEVQAQAQRLGCHDFLPKPFATDHLLQTLRKVLDSPLK
jgi:two-component system cell cycle sensor histidine kinase/response regulator CckA